MTYEEAINEITQTFGSVPTFMKSIPHNVLPAEWGAFKATQLEPSALDPKTKELIGVGLAALSHCRYCAYYHAEVAKVFGATQDEIEDAVRFAKSSAGWSTYINGMQTDFEGFKHEIDAACAHVRASMSAAAGA